ncbi:MAG: two-component system response regulator CreB [Pseudomonadota bacterium]|nr:MAG: two-component system response regulator CreB [Pseudomonadota bacterium]
MRQVLLVEDEVAIADTLVFALNGDGYSARHVVLGAEALQLLRGGGFDLVILDVGLPDMTGFEALRQLRQFSQVPVMFLTARGGEIDRVVGLEIGADDYVVKPFSPREVVARVRAILKRSSGTAAAGGHRIANGEFLIDAARASVTYCGRPLKLTALEFRLLQQLVAHPQVVQSRAQLLAALGITPDAGYERNIDTHIKALRAKLREVAADREPILTHRGLGYSYQPRDGA